MSREIRGTRDQVGVSGFHPPCQVRLQHGLPICQLIVQVSCYNPLTIYPPSHLSLQSFVAGESTLVEHTQSLYRQSEHAHSSFISRTGQRPETVILGPGIFRQLQHPAFTSLHLQQCITEVRSSSQLNTNFDFSSVQDEGGRRSSSLQTVVSCKKIVTLSALQAVLRSGQMDRMFLRM